MYWLLGRKLKLSTNNKFFLKQSSNQAGLAKYNSGVRFHFQHRKSRAFPIESLAHDSGRTLLCAEYCYYQQLKRESAATAARQQAIAKTPAKRSLYQIPNTIVVFAIFFYYLTPLIIQSIHRIWIISTFFV
jgi:hypothetical protein